MSINKYSSHLLVLPEDKANADIANVFLLHPKLDERLIQVLPPAGGWNAVLKKFTDYFLQTMRQYPERRIVLLIDFDEDEERLGYIEQRIPEDLKNRVFVLGVLSEPEKLRSSLKKSFEDIGEALSSDCSENTDVFWKHELLKHNKTELERLVSSVKPFLFQSS